MQKYFFGLFVCMMCILCADAEVVTTSAGKLKKAIKDPNVETLTINGIINAKDIITISELPNLKELDLTNVILDGDKEAKFKGVDIKEMTNIDSYNIGQGENTFSLGDTKLYLVGTSKLKVLRLPKQCYILKVFGELHLDLLCARAGFFELRKKTKIPPCKSISIYPESERQSLTDNYGLFFRKENENYFSRKLYGKKIVYSRKKQAEINVDTLFLPEKKYLTLSEIQNIDPSVIVVGKSPIIYKYRGKEHMITLQDHSAFAYAENENIESVQIPNHMIGIDDGAFYNCHNLNNILGTENLQWLGDYVFSGTNISDTIVLGKEFKGMSRNAFTGSKVKVVEFKCEYAPEIYGERYPCKEISNIIFIIPKGTREKFAIGPWREAILIEKGNYKEEAVNITVKTVGTLKDYINDSNAMTIQNLILKGVIDDTDFETLSKCKNLQSLDLSECHCVKSLAKLQKGREESAALLSLLSMATEGAYNNESMKYANGLGNYGAVKYTEIIMNRLKNMENMIDNKQPQIDITCYFPYKALSFAKVLKKIVLPTTCTTVPSGVFSDLTMLNTVILSPKTTHIEASAFNGCSSLTNISLPATLNRIDGYAFFGCPLSYLDLSNTSITNAEFGCKLKKLVLPKTIKYICTVGEKSVIDNGGDIYIPLKDSSKINMSANNYYTVHVLRGCKAGWGSFYNVVDDIDW